jgi:hypothetical protein
LSPILGIIASQNYPRSTNSYESIATVTVGVLGSSSISFTSIPSTYKHLEIRAIARTARVNDGDAIYVRFNNDSGSNYSEHRLEGNGSTASATGAASSTSITLNRFAAANETSGIFGATVISVLDYANTSKNKTLRALVGYDANGSGVVALDSGAWLSTTAINRIDFLPLNTIAFAQYSSFALYGVKG